MVENNGEVVYAWPFAVFSKRYQNLSCGEKEQMFLKIEISAENNLTLDDHILMKELRQRIEDHMRKLVNKDRTDFGLTHLHSVKVDKE